MIERWERQEGPPRSLEVHWIGSNVTGLWATVNTVHGKQQWKLTIGDEEPRYMLTIDGREVDRLRTDEWPATWELASGGKP